MTARGEPDLLRFAVNEARAALPLALVKEVVAAPLLAIVPGARRQVAGVVLARGIAIPVYDLARFAPLWSGAPGPAAAVAGAAHLIVCAWGEVVFGILGDGVDLVRGAGDASGGGSDTGGMRGEFVGAVLRDAEGSLAILDHERLFAALGVPAQRGRDAMEEDGEEDPAGR